MRKRLLLRSQKGKRRVVKSYFRSCPNQKRCARIFARRHKPRKGAAGRRLCFKICKKRKGRKNQRRCYRACKKRIFQIIKKRKGVKKVCTKSCTTIKTVLKGKKGTKGAKGKPVIKVSTKCVVRCTGLVKKILAKKASKNVKGKASGKKVAKKTAAKKPAAKKAKKKPAAKKPAAKPAAKAKR